MGERNTPHSNHFMTLGADQRSQAYIYPEPCMMHGSFTTFPHPNVNTTVPAPGSLGNFYVPHLPGHQEGALVYGRPPANGIQQWHYITNVGAAFTPPANYFYPYVAAPAALRTSPVPANHGLRDGLPVSGTQGSTGNNADNLGRNDPRMDSTRESSKQRDVAGNSGNLQHHSALAGPSTSAAPVITTANESDVSSNDSVSREHGGSDSAPLLENGTASATMDLPVPANHGLRVGLPVSGTTDDSVSREHGGSDSAPHLGNGATSATMDLPVPANHVLRDGLPVSGTTNDSVSREHGGSDSAPLLGNGVTSATMDFPVPANHVLRDGLPVSGTTDDSVSRESGGSDSAPLLQNGAMSATMDLPVPANHGLHDGLPVSGTTDDSVSRAHVVSGSALLLENGVQRSGSRSAGGPDTVLQNNNNYLLQGNYVGQAYQFPGNPWLNMPSSSSGSTAPSWAWSQAAPITYPPVGAGGYVIGAGNMAMQGYQIPSSNGGLTGFMYPPIPQGSPQYHPHLSPNMQSMAGHTVSTYAQMTASPGRQLQLTSSNMGPLLPSDYRMYRPHQRELTIRGTNASHHNLRTGVSMLGVPRFRGVAIVDQHRDMRLDVDRMSYEELLALGERIGNVTLGLSEDIIAANLKTRIFLSTETPTPLENVASDEDQKTVCVICQSDYKDGEKIGILNCGHEYHEDCVKKWLAVKNSCAICKSKALSTEKKDKEVVTTGGD
ncbi:probable E3 ubiquitin-protein ligase ZFP1 [Solanum pennellii]|uniref:RING-type E3 ubiquitin transferase n=1 Tax=Solanum pennellii TaxID=28526 RepID=A0ABM1H6V2_SOLPN|nr:probable E3 ubiquitin-protein ligase ZFP1 [Solanum pennellii]